MTVTDLTAVTADPTVPSIEPRPLLAVEPPRARSSVASWSAAHRLGFRFIFAYLVLYLFPFPLDLLPWPAQWWGALQEVVARFTEIRVFGLADAVPIVPTGSGDTMAAWAIQTAWLLLALGAAIVWTILDRRRRDYRRLHEWLRVYVRFALAGIMFGYGFAKIIPNQMPAPSLERLVQPWGEFSPMGVLWSFMGYSSVYQIFTGFGEALGSAFLAFRRTATLGALLLSAVLANVVLMNYTFDVPVKLYSTNLLLMALFLLAPDVRRLLDLLVLGRQPAPPVHEHLFLSRRWRIAAVVLAVLYVGYNSYGGLTAGLERYRQATGPDAPKLPVFGIWDVEEWRRNGVVRPPLLSDSSLVRRIVFGQLNRAAFRTMADSVERYSVTADSAKRVLTLKGRFGPDLMRTISYVRLESDRLILTEVVGSDSIVMRLRRVDERRFPLLTRGYHWIQEQPFNR
jgi:hypothetical protein